MTLSRGFARAGFDLRKQAKSKHLFGFGLVGLR
jgi:hypothetical protein